MLRECVALSIDASGRLVGLPALIEHYTPDLDRLPQFVLKLARTVDWRTEKACFCSLAEVGQYATACACRDLQLRVSHSTSIAVHFVARSPSFPDHHRHTRKGMVQCLRALKLSCNGLQCALLTSSSFESCTEWRSMARQKNVATDLLSYAWLMQQP